jgi:AcrR family transcriptional regulator
VAAGLGVAPNALYRYFPDRDALLAALGDEAARHLLAAMRDRVAAADGEAAVRALAAAYLDFAQRRPALYEVFMAKHAYPRPDFAAYQALWGFVVGTVAGWLGEARAAAAAGALWVFLHGAAELDGAGFFAAGVPGDAVDRGIDALLRGLAPAVPAGHPPRATGT